MKLKQKIMTLLSLTALTAVLLVVGVWALKTINFTIDGNLSYVAPGVEATISKGTVANAEWQNAGDANTKMPQTEITNSDTETTLATKFSYWQNVNLNFNENGDDITITFSITNNSSSKYIVIGVSTSYASATNCTIAVDTTSTTLDPQASHTFTLTMAITDKDENATMTNFAVVFNMQLSNSKPIDLKYDEDAGYYYVEMGTYQGNPVKWRLVGVKEEGASETTKFTGSTAPSAGSVGTFILETLMVETADKQKFNASRSDGNNYATSDIRKYLNGDYITALNLANDATYNAITAREITDLHTDIGWAYSSDGTTVPNEGGDDAYAPPTGTKPNATYNTSVEGATGADKLWLMSVKEIYTLVGGGALGANGTIPYDWSAYYDNLIWRRNSTDEYGVYYWLRSPDPDLSYGAFYVSDSGDWDGSDVSVTYAVRPAFNLNF